MLHFPCWHMWNWMKLHVYDSIICAKLTCPYKWFVGNPVSCVSFQDDRAGCWIQISTVQMSRLAVTFWTISAKRRKYCLSEASNCTNNENTKYLIILLLVSSPHGQMWRCDLKVVTQSPSQPWHLLGIHPGCWSRWLVGGTGQTARCYTKSYLSRVT